MTTPRDRVLAYLHARASIPGVAIYDTMLPRTVYSADGSAHTLTASDITELVRRIDAIDNLFAAGPDTPARTSYRATAPGSGEHITCVEVPVYDLAAALQWSPNLIDSKD